MRRKVIRPTVITWHASLTKRTLTVRGVAARGIFTTGRNRYVEVAVVGTGTGYLRVKTCYNPICETRVKLARTLDRPVYLGRERKGGEEGKRDIISLVEPTRSALVIGVSCVLRITQLPSAALCICEKASYHGRVTELLTSRRGDVRTDLDCNQVRKSDRNGPGTLILRNERRVAFGRESSRNLGTIVALYTLSRRNRNHTATGSTREIFPRGTRS